MIRKTAREQRWKLALVGLGSSMAFCAALLAQPSGSPEPFPSAPDATVRDRATADLWARAWGSEIDPAGSAMVLRPGLGTSQWDVLLGSLKEGFIAQGRFEETQRTAVRIGGSIPAKLRELSAHGLGKFEIHVVAGTLGGAPGAEIPIYGFLFDLGRVSRDVDGRPMLQLAPMGRAHDLESAQERASALAARLQVAERLPNEPRAPWRPPERSCCPDPDQLLCDICDDECGLDWRQDLEECDDEFDDCLIDAGLDAAVCSLICVPLPPPLDLACLGLCAVRWARDVDTCLATHDACKRTARDDKDLCEQRCEEEICP